MVFSPPYIAPLSLHRQLPRFLLSLTFCVPATNPSIPWGEISICQSVQVLSSACETEFVDFAQLQALVLESRQHPDPLRHPLNNPIPPSPMIFVEKGISLCARQGASSCRSHSLYWDVHVRERAAFADGTEHVLYSPYAKVLVNMSVRHLHDTMLQHKFIYYTTTTRILFKIKLQCR